MNGYRLLCNVVVGTKIDRSSKKHVVVPELLRRFEAANGLDGCSIGVSPKYMDATTVRNIVSRTVLKVYRGLVKGTDFQGVEDTDTIKPTFWGTEEVDRLNRKMNSRCC